MSGGEISSESLRRDECSCRFHPSGRLHMRPLQLYLVVHVHITFVMQGVSEQLFPRTPKLVELSGEPARRAASAFAKRDGGTLHRQFHDGVGATLNTVHMVQGVRAQTTSDSNSINWLELKTVHLAILHFLDLLKNRSVMFRSDNLATIYNLDKQGGTHSPDLLPGLEDSPDVSPTQNPGPSSAPEGRTQCSGGSAQQIPQGDTDGMIPLSKGLLRNRKKTRRFRHQPVHHSPEPPDSILH